MPDPALGAEAASTAMRLRIWNPTPLTVRTDLTLPSGTKVLATRLDGTPEGHVDGGAPGEPAVDSRVADVGPTELRPVLWPWQVRTCTLAPAAAEGQGPRANR